MVSYRMYAGMKISLIRRNSYDFKQLLERLEYEVVQGSDKIEITTLINDSRK